MNGTHVAGQGRATSPLDNVRVVLVEPASPGNIGATARVLRNTGISQLVLVNPPAPWCTEEARWLAHGSQEILESCQVAPDLAGAVADAHLVVGTTHRLGRFREVETDLKQVAAEVASLAFHHRVALVFGREKDGLWREELLHCDRLLRFPTAVSYPSLNLSHAVLLLAYEVFAAVQQAPARPSRPGDLVTAAEREQLVGHLLQALETIGFRGRNADPANFARVLRRVLNRIPLARRDLRVIHRVCGQVDKFAARRAPQAALGEPATPHSQR
ncbi:MAG: RNA methyltransferase [Candidatus Latescibacterota bacterium]